MFRVFTDNGSNIVAAFKANNIEDGIAKSDTDSVKLEESEELFPDQDELDKMEEGSTSSEVDIFDTCEEEHQEACRLEALRLLCT